MFDVLVYVYENYWRGDACPDAQHLERKLNSVGFEPDDIEQALLWLDGLRLVAQDSPWPEAHQASADGYSAMAPSAGSMRIYTPAEQDHLGSACLGFITFLDDAGVLPAAMREIVIDRAMAAPGGPVVLDELKVIVLLVYWRFGQEPDTLVLDELCDVAALDRVAH